MISNNNNIPKENVFEYNVKKTKKGFEATVLVMTKTEHAYVNLHSFDWKYTGYFRVNLEDKYMGLN